MIINNALISLPLTLDCTQSGYLLANDFIFIDCKFSLFRAY